MSDDTILDDLIAEKLSEYIPVADAADAARRKLLDAEATQANLGIEMQRLLIARSVLRDGKAYGYGDANVELSELIAGANRG